MNSVGFAIGVPVALLAVSWCLTGYFLFKIGTEMYYNHTEYKVMQDAE